ncbi:hypothetical protein MMC17_003791 [Xylographa soralifera]|nr:hypothetical protein [Xylographa soralifera]
MGTFNLFGKADFVHSTETLKRRIGIWIFWTGLAVMANGRKFRNSPEKWASMSFQESLVVTAKCESEIANSISRRPATSSSAPTTLSHLLLELRTAIATKEALPEDVFQAQTCLGWLHWVMKQPALAVSALPTSLPQATGLAKEKQGTLSRWTHVCMIKSAYILGASQEIVSSPADVVDTYKSALSLLSNTSLATGNAQEYRIWAERLLIRSCMLSEQLLKPDPAIDSQTSLAPFRAWSNFWESSSQNDLNIGDGSQAGRLQERRLAWRAYHNMLSHLLQHGYVYPGITHEKHLGDDLTEHPDVGARLRQSTELRRVEATYEGYLIKETSFPQADETNMEVLNFVDQVMANWSILCAPDWQDEDVGHGGQEGASREVLEILYRAATRTFHSTSILRHLFTVHASLGEFDLAGKALNSYLEIAMKGRARVEKSGEPETDLDSDETILNSIAAGIKMYTAFGRRSEAPKSWDLVVQLERWLRHHNHEFSAELQINNKVSTASEPGSTSQNKPMSQQAIYTASRAIGIGCAYWGRITYDASQRSDLQKKATIYFRQALQVVPAQEDTETLYALALVLAETRDIDGAIATVKKALSINSTYPSGTKSHRRQQRSEQNDSKRRINQWHLLTLLLSARQDFDTAQASCEAALDEYNSVQVRAQTSPILQIERLSLSEKQHIVEVKITQISLAEVIEGPDVAVNASGELLELYTRLFKPGKPESSIQKLESSPPPSTSNGTMKSFRGTVFGRSKDPRASIRSTTAAESIRSQRHSNDTSRPPTISITNRETLMHEQLSPPDSSHSHHILRHASRRLQKRNSMKSILSRTASPARTASTTRGSNLANTTAERVNGESQYRPTSAGSRTRNEVGIAVSHNLDTIPASPNPKRDPFSTSLADRTVSPAHVDEAKTKSTTHNPFEPQYSKLDQQRHAVSLLLKIWLFIAGLYRRAKLYDDAQGAVEEAFKQVKSVEATVSSQASSARAFETPGWGGAKSVEELWADAYAERGNLFVAQSTPHQAMIEYESALSHYPDHAIATIGLSSILLDIYSQTIPPQPERSLLQAEYDQGVRDRTKESSRPILASVSAPNSKNQFGGGSSIQEDLDIPSQEDTNVTPPRDYSDTDRRTPETLDRLAARDRAYGLLSSLTKLGTGWDNSEAWFALARAYEESGQVEKAKDVLWWVVELEEKLRKIAAPREIYPIIQNGETSVGAAIFRVCPTTLKSELLIAKRIPKEEAYSNCREIPGGHVDPWETVTDALNREVLEEAGLLVDEVIPDFETMRWESSSEEVDVQLNYVVNAEEPVAVELNLREHSMWMWACKQGIETPFMTEEMKKVIKDGLRCLLPEF